MRRRRFKFPAKREKNFSFSDFSDVSADLEPLRGRADGTRDGSTLPGRARHSQTAFFKHFQTKGKQKWQPYFYKAGRHILQTPPLKKKKKKSKAAVAAGTDGAGGASGGRGGNKGAFMASKA